MPDFPASFTSLDQEAIHCIHRLRREPSLQQQFQENPQQTVTKLTSDPAIQQMLLRGADIFLGNTAFPDRPFQSPLR